MAKPQDVNPKNFKVSRVVYDDGHFSVAWGKWEDGTHRLAMRWNGDSEDPGYPKLFKHPVWFVLPPNSELAPRFTQSLLGASGAKTSETLETLRELFPDSSST